MQEHSKTLPKLAILTLKEQKTFQIGKFPPEFSWLIHPTDGASEVKTNVQDNFFPNKTHDQNQPFGKCRLAYS